MRENRETPWLPARSRAGRRENAMSDKSLMHGGGESYTRHSTDEAAEQKRATAGGGCGGKAVDQGEHAESLTRAGHRAGKAGQAGWSVCAKQQGSRTGS
jgi:hypothetical protein